MNDDIPPNLHRTADRVKRTLEAAAEFADPDPESRLDGPVEGRVRRRRLTGHRLLVAAIAVVTVAGVTAALTGGLGDESDQLSAGDASQEMSDLGRPLDLGFPPDLVDDAGRVRALLSPIGPRHPRSGGLAFDNNGETSVIVVAVNDPAEARADLEAAMDDPSRLRIEQQPSDEVRLAVAVDAEQLVGDRGMVGQPGRGVVPMAELDAGEEELAAELMDRFGPVLQISVATHPFPYTDRNKCPELPATEPAVTNTIEVLTPQITTSSAASALVTVTNTTDEPISIREPSASPGVWLSMLLLPGTDTVVGFSGFTMFTAEGPRDVSLAPGQSYTVGATISRIACHVTPGTGTALRPGDYEFVVEIELPGRTLRSVSAPVTIVDELPGPEARAAAGPARPVDPLDPDSAALLDRFLTFVRERTGATWSAIPPGEGMGVPGGRAGVSGLFANPAEWEFRMDGELVNTLDLIRDLERVETTLGPPRWCSGPRRARSAWRSSGPLITIEQRPESSCDEWLAFGLMVDNGHLVGVWLFTDVP